MWHRWTHPPLTEMEFCWCVWMRKTQVSMRSACSNSNMLPRLLFRLPPLGRHYWFAAKASKTVWYTCYFRKSLMLIPPYVDITNLLPMPARLSGIPTIVGIIPATTPPRKSKNETDITWSFFQKKQCVVESAPLTWSKLLPLKYELLPQVQHNFLWMNSTYRHSWPGGKHYLLRCCLSEG